MMRIEDTFQDDNLIWGTKALPNKIENSEDIILVIREDILLLGFRALSFFVITIVLFVVNFLVASTGAAPIVKSLANVTFFTVVSMLIVAFAYQVHNYYLSLQIVTTKRLIDIDQRSLFNREVNELAIEKVEDISYKQNGVWGAIFDYGNVSVQTAAEVSTDTHKSNAMTGGFLFDNVPNPAKVHSIIAEIYHQNQADQAHLNAQLNAKYMSEMMDGKKEEALTTPADNSVEVKTEPQ